VQLDPLLLQAVQLLNQVYRSRGQAAKADQLIAQYRAAMGINMKTE
jgi:hypothetical protein